MQKKYVQSLFIALCLLSFTSVKAQTYTHVRITAVATPGIGHDSTECMSHCIYGYNVTMDSSFVGDTMRIIDINTGYALETFVNTTGVSPWTESYGTAAYNSYVTDDQLTGPGILFAWDTVKVLAATGDTLKNLPNTYYLSVPNPCIYGHVSGKVYVDNNSNCVFDAGDIALESILINSTANLFSPYDSIIEHAYSDGAGAYDITVQKSWMTNYKVVPPPEYMFIFPATPCFSGSYTYSSLPQTGADFPLQCSGSIDVQCYAESPGDVRVATPFYMMPYVSNIGCDTASGQLKLVLDSRVIYDSASSYNPANYVSGDTLTWDYWELSNLSVGAYWNSFSSYLHLTPDSTVHVGDTLCFRVFTNILPADIDSSNNDQSFCLPVVYSYDPNEKEVTPKGTGTPGYIPTTTDSLVYTVHFQNTGTSYAGNISVIDTLDSHLDISSFKILATSFAMVPKWLGPGIIEFDFNNINLPDSTTSEIASHGFVRFQAKLNAGLPIGTQIKNRADIYFDSNPAVVTNTVLNTIQAPATTGLQTPRVAPIKFYPNPATEFVTVENLQGGHIQIEDMAGSVIIEQDITDNKTTIDINRLANGVYVAKCIGKNGVTVKKFIKY